MCYIWRNFFQRYIDSMVSNSTFVVHDISRMTSRWRICDPFRLWRKTKYNNLPGDLSIHHSRKFWWCSIWLTLGLSPEQTLKMADIVYVEFHLCVCVISNSTKYVIFYISYQIPFDLPLSKGPYEILSLLCIHTRQLPFYNFIFFSESTTLFERELFVGCSVYHTFCRKPSNNYLSHVYFQLCQWCERTIFLKHITGRF
jgi:hypothetical protein